MMRLNEARRLLEGKGPRVDVWYHATSKPMTGPVRAPLYLFTTPLSVFYGRHLYSFRIDPKTDWADIRETQWTNPRMPPLFSSMDSLGYDEGEMKKLRDAGFQAAWHSGEFRRGSPQALILDASVLKRVDYQITEAEARYFEDLPKAERDRLAQRRRKEYAKIIRMKFPVRAKFGLGGEPIEVLGPTRRFEPYKSHPAHKPGPETWRDASQLLCRHLNGEKFVTLATQIRDLKGNRWVTPGPPMKPFDLFKLLESRAIGQCYPFAFQMALKVPTRDMDNPRKFKVLHGKVTDKWTGKSHLHAWVEMGDKVFDWQTSSTKPRGVDKAVWYEMFQPWIHALYTAEQVIINCARHGHHGPWESVTGLNERAETVKLGDPSLRQHLPAARKAFRTYMEKQEKIGLEPVGKARRFIHYLVGVDEDARGNALYTFGVEPRGKSGVRWEKQFPDKNYEWDKPRKTLTWRTPKHNLVKNQREAYNSVPGRSDMAYRGMSFEEWKLTKRRGYVQSKGSYNLGQEGLTFYGYDPGTGFHYSAGFAPLQFTCTRSRPGVVIAIPRELVLTHEDRPEDIPQSELAHLGKVSIKKIKGVWFIFPTEMRSGSLTLRVEEWGDRYYQVRHASSSAPGVGGYAITDMYDRELR